MRVVGGTQGYACTIPRRPERQRLSRGNRMKPIDSGFSMPAEWAPHSGCWMGWPKRESIWHGHIEAARDDYARVAQTIARFEPLTMLADSELAADASRRCGSTVRVVA